MVNNIKIFNSNENNNVPSLDELKICSLRLHLPLLSMALRAGKYENNKNKNLFSYRVYDKYKATW